MASELPKQRRFCPNKVLSKLAFLFAVPVFIPASLLIDEVQLAASNRRNTFQDCHIKLLITVEVLISSNRFGNSDSGSGSFVKLAILHRKPKKAILKGRSEAGHFQSFDDPIRSWALGGRIKNCRCSFFGVSFEGRLAVSSKFEMDEENGWRCCC